MRSQRGIDMKLLWLALLGFFRTFYLAYAVWCGLFPLALIVWLYLLVSDWGAAHPALQSGAQAIAAGLVALALFAIAYIYVKRSPNNPNPWQSGFMAWFGTLKIFHNDGGSPEVKLHWPSKFLVENPRGYRISGTDLRQILDALQPGDILLRGYEGYVDGEFIRRSSVSAQSEFKPGWFTHVALFVGDLSAKDCTHVPAGFAQQPDYFSPGPQRVIHAMAKGVHTEDILTFCRCDYLCVLRLPPQLTIHSTSSTPLARCKQSKPPTASDALVSDMLDDLQAGQTVARERVVAAMRLSALEKIGEEYDFDRSDTQAFDRFSCAELLYFCLRGVLDAIDLRPLPHALYPLAPLLKNFKVLERATLTPDDYRSLARQGRLERVWEDRFSKTLT